MCDLVGVADQVQDIADPIFPLPIFGASFDLFDLSCDQDWALNAPDVDFLSSFELPPSEQPQRTGASKHTSPYAVTSIVDPGNSDALHEAFRQSIGRWTPDDQHYRSVEEQRLSSKDMNVDTPVRADASLLTETLTTRTRDKLLTMAIVSCEPANVSSVASAIPAVEVLDRLIDLSLATHKDQIDGFIHLPTLSKADCRIEKLAALVVDGAIKSPSRTVQRFGLGLSDIVDNYLHRVV